MKFFRLGLVAVAASMLLTGCETMYKLTQAKHENVTDFLPESEKLEKQPAQFPFQLFYLKKDCPKFANIYIAPVSTEYLRKSKNWAKFDEKLAGKLGQDVNQLAKYMQDRMVAEVKALNRPDKPALVNTPKAKKCAIVETAIVAIVPNKAELTILGFAANAVAPGISLFTTRLAAGSISVECKVRNSDTGEIVAMYSATINDQAAVLNTKSVTWYGSAKRSIERVAKDTVTILANRDYSNIKRDDPVKLFSK